MENEKLNKGIEQLKSIVMTDAEKMKIFEHVLNTPFSSRRKLIPSPWTSYSTVVSALNKNREVCSHVVLTSWDIVWKLSNVVVTSLIKLRPQDIVTNFHTILPKEDIHTERDVTQRE